MTRPFRRDSFAEYLASDTDLPYETWLQEHKAIAEARRRTAAVGTQTTSRPRGWAVALLVVIMLASVVVTGVAIAAGYLKGAAQ
jgi:hypothetical protein